MRNTNTHIMHIIIYLYSLFVMVFNDFIFLTERSSRMRNFYPWLVTYFLSTHIIIDNNINIWLLKASVGLLKSITRCSLKVALYSSHMIAHVWYNIHCTRWRRRFDCKRPTVIFRDIANVATVLRVAHTLHQKRTKDIITIICHYLYI